MPAAAHGFKLVLPDATARAGNGGTKRFRLRVLRERGTIDPDVDVQVSARTIKYLGSELFRRYVADESRTLNDVDHDLRPMIEILCRGLVIRGDVRSAAFD